VHREEASHSCSYHNHNRVAAHTELEVEDAAAAQIDLDLLCDLTDSTNLDDKAVHREDRCFTPSDFLA
jgi:hypothetical protein